MELKKSPEADLEKKKSLFLYIGIVVTLSLVLLMFEWSAQEGDGSILGDQAAMDIEDEIIPITRPEVKPPPPPPKPQVTEILEIVDDEEEIEDEIEMEDMEVDQDTEIEIVEVEEEEEDDTVFAFAVIENKPEFPGGDIALRTYIAKNTKYPVIAKENNVSGKVFVQFVIGKDGKVSDVKPARKVDPYLDREAVRVVKSMPAWKPGKQRGKAVKVQYIVPISFVLH